MMRTATRNWCTPPTLCFLFLFVGLLAAAPAHMLGDPGTLWHTIVGERMLQSGRLINADPFSFTCHGQPWIAQQWLGELGMALISRLAGLDGLVLATAVLLASVYSLLFGRFIRSGLSWLACVILILLVIAASSYHFLPRPHLATIAFTAWMFSLLNDIEAGRRGPAWLLALPPLFILWTNTHGGALGGIVTATLILGAWFCLPAERPSRFRLLPTAPAGLSPLLLGGIMALSFASVLVNPYGAALPRVWISLMHSAVLPKLIIEHAPLAVFSADGAVILSLAAIYLALLAVCWRHGRRITWLMPIVWLGLTFTRIRHGPLFAVIAAVAIADMLPHCPPLFRRGLVRGRALSPGAPGHSALSTRRLPPACLPIALVLLCLALQAADVAVPVLGSGWSRWSAERWPVSAVEALRRQHRPDGRPLRVFNDLGYGGYLIHAAPETRVYIDDRCELYRDDGLLQYAEFTRQPETIDAFAAYEGIDVALTKRGSAFDRHFEASPAWKPLHRDATASLYARTAQVATRPPSP